MILKVTPGVTERETWVQILTVLLTSPVASGKSVTPLSLCFFFFLVFFGLVFFFVENADSNTCTQDSCISGKVARTSHVVCAQ